VCREHIISLASIADELLDKFALCSGTWSPPTLHRTAVAGGIGDENGGKPAFHPNAPAAGRLSMTIIGK